VIRVGVLARVAIAVLCALAEGSEGGISPMDTGDTSGATKTIVAGGVVHEIPPDLVDALLGDREALRLWGTLTPLARNEWICWVQSAKKAQTRTDRISRAREDLKAGKRRPCCWPGCSHRVKNGK